MSRLFLIILASIVIMVPSFSFADDMADQKAKVGVLFKAYKAALKEQEIAEALAAAEELYALSPEVYGKISKTNAAVVFNLAQLYSHMGHWRNTAEYYQEHVDILDALEVPKDDKYLLKLGLLSSAHFEVRHTEQAIKYGKMALKLAKKLNVSEGVLAEFEMKVGVSYSQKYGQTRQARQHIDKAYRLFAKSYGEQHFKTANAKFWQAKMDMAYDKNQRASKKLEQVLTVYDELLPAGHDRTLQVHAFLVQSYEKMGNKDKATEHCIAVATERPKDFDREIKPLYKIPPKYPHSAQVRGKSGYVIGEFTVDEFGQTENIKIIETSDEIFNEESIKALSKFRYAPSIRNGKRVKTEGVLHKVSFQMVPR